MNKKIISKISLFTIIISIFILSLSFGLKDTESMNSRDVISLEDYLGKEYYDLDENAICDLDEIYSEILKLEIKKALNEEESKKYNELWSKFDEKIIEYDINLEYYDNNIYIEGYINKINKQIDELIKEDNGKMQKELFELKKEIKNLSLEIKKNEDLYYDEIDEPDIIKEYEVDRGEINKDDFKDFENHRILWNKVKRIIPRKYLNMIRVFEINTDGEGNNMAYVVQEDDNGKNWRLGVDIEDLIKSEGEIGYEFENTVLHEFAHILTLNPSQMQNNIINSNTYVVDEGSLKEDSYLNLFYQKFWKKIIKDFDNSDMFYRKYSNQFLTDYAMTNPVEDLAESYYHFVLKDKPSGNSIKEKKIKFFYDFEELVKQRNEIRKNINFNK